MIPCFLCKEAPHITGCIPQNTGLCQITPLPVCVMHPMTKDAPSTPQRLLPKPANSLAPPQHPSPHPQPPDFRLYDRLPWNVNRKTVNEYLTYKTNNRHFSDFYRFRNYPPLLILYIFESWPCLSIYFSSLLLYINIK